VAGIMQLLYIITRYVRWSETGLTDSLFPQFRILSFFIIIKY